MTFVHPFFVIGYLLPPSLPPPPPSLLDTSPSIAPPLPSLRPPPPQPVYRVNNYARPVSGSALLVSVQARTGSGIVHISPI